MIKETLKTFVFPEGTVTPSCHASTVLPLEDGTVLTAWFGGEGEKKPDVEIYVSKKNRDGSFTPPVCVTEGDDIPHWNPVLFQRKNGGIVLFYKYGKEIPEWKTKYILLSPDGTPLSEPAELVPGDTGGRGPVKNKCIRLKSGRILAPASTEGKNWRAFIDVSDDDGKSWSRSDYIGVAGYRGKPTKLIQPTLWEDDEGTVHCLMRSDRGALYRSSSQDGGMTWIRARRTSLPNNNSGVDLARDGSGRLWLCCNPVGKNWGERYPLVLACSQDNGKHFETVLTLESEEGEYSYPAVVCYKNRLYITYTYNRKQIVYIEAEI